MTEAQFKAIFPARPITNGNMTIDQVTEVMYRFETDLRHHGLERFADAVGALTEMVLDVEGGNEAVKEAGDELRRAVYNAIEAHKEGVTPVEDIFADLYRAADDHESAA